MKTPTEKKTKIAKSFKKTKKFDVLPQENSVLTSQKNIPLQFICFLNEFVQKTFLKIPRKFLFCFVPHSQGSN